MRLGVYATALDSSQSCALTVQAINDHLAANPLDDVVMFVSRFGVCPVWPRFAVFQEQEVWCWPDAVAAIDFISAQKLIRTIGPKRKLLYLWDLEWCFVQRSFSDNASVYLSKDLEIVTRSQDHADIVSTCWRDSKVVEEFNVGKLA